MRALRLTVGLAFLAVTMGLVACSDQKSSRHSEVISVPNPSNAPALFGGEKLERNQLISRYVVFLKFLDGQGQPRVCTGSLLTSEIVLTAAHCVAEDLSTQRVYFATDLRDPDSVSQEYVRSVVLAKRPSEYLAAKKDRTRPNQYDVALLKLSSPAPNFMRHFQITDESFPIDQFPRVVALGYGVESLSYKTGQTQGTRELRVVIIPRLQSKFPEMWLLDQSKGAGACSGDSGGPAYFKYQDGFALAAIAISVKNLSGDNACAETADYLPIFSVRDWIRKETLNMLQITK